MTLYLRPVHVGDGPLIGMAICHTAGAVLTDADVVEHWPANARGADMRDAAIEFHGATDVQWAGPVVCKL